MKKIINEENFKLFEGDSFKVLSKLIKKSVDLIVADPPYFLSSGGISCHSGKQVKVDKGKRDKSISIEEKISFNRKWIKKCKELLKDNGSIWISGTMHNIYAVGVALEKEGFSIINNITWVKPNPVPNLACRCFTNSTETILWAKKINGSKKGKHTFNYLEMKKENNNKQMKDVWLINLPKNSEKRNGKHPTQKPLDLLLRIIKCSTKENDLVLDPFNGSGTTGIASIILKRRYIGIEIDESYCELTLKRFNELKREVKDEKKI